MEPTEKTGCKLTYEYKPGPGAGTRYIHYDFVCREFAFGKTQDNKIFKDEFNVPEITSAIKYQISHKTAYFDTIVRHSLFLYEDYAKKSGGTQDLDDREYLSLCFFLKTVVGVLKETGKKYFKTPNLEKDLIHEYWKLTNIDKYKNINDAQAEKIGYRINACEFFLGLCIDDSNQAWFDSIGKGCDGNDLNREKAVVETCSRLFEIYETTVDSEQEGACSATATDIRPLLIEGQRWLASRYNLLQARKIRNFLETIDDRPPSEATPQTIPPVEQEEDEASGSPEQDEIGRASRFRYRYDEANWFCDNALPEFVAASAFVFLCFLDHFFNISRSFGWKTSVFVLALYAFELVCVLRLFWPAPGRRLDVQLYLPRMAAGIVVGYLVLLSDEAWRWVFSQPLSLSASHDAFGWLMIFLRFVLPLAAVLVYIAIEINNVKGIDPRTKPRKALLLLARGLAYSILIGVLYSDIFGESIVTRVADGKDLAVAQSQLSCARGIFGNIYPEVVFYLSPLALFIGVFLQLLWEDKTLTEKI